jgi:probable HAF family extracellular repeat protein
MARARAKSRTRTAERRSVVRGCSDLPNSPNSLQQRRLRLRRAGLAAAVALATAGGALAGAEAVSAAPSDAAAAAARSAPSRVITVKARDLGSIKGTVASWAQAVNDRGQVVGTNVFRDEPRVERPFLWERGKMRDLGTFDGRSARAVDINNAGQILVDTDPYAGTARDRAFVWYRGRKVDIGTLAGDTTGVMINERGQVLATSRTKTGEQHAVIWYRGTLRDLGTLPGSGHVEVRDMNDRGDVVGFVDSPTGLQEVWWPRGRPGPIPIDVFSNLQLKINDRGQVALTLYPDDPSDGQHAAIWSGGRIRAVSPVTAAAVDINDRGVVVGSTQAFWDDIRAEGLVWRNGRVTVLPVPAGWQTATAQKVSNRGQILGVADDLEFTKPQPLVWQGGKTVLLTPLRGRALSRATDINERGQIPGESYSVNADGGWTDRHAVLWTVTPRR